MTYGLNPKLRSVNPIEIAFHEWAALLKDLKKPLLHLSVLVLFLSSTGCQAGVRKLHEARLMNRLAGLKSYRGTLSESGVLQDGEKLVSEISFSRPDHYFIKVLSPERFKCWRSPRTA